MLVLGPSPIIEDRVQPREILGIRIEPSVGSTIPSVQPPNDDRGVDGLL